MASKGVCSVDNILCARIPTCPRYFALQKQKYVIVAANEAPELILFMTYGNLDP